MTYADIKALTVKELHANLKDERALYQKMKMTHAISPLDNPRKLTQTRKLIARYLTEINSRRVENEINDSVNI